MRARLVSLCVLVFLFLAHVTWAQGVKTGGITGVVKDPSGAVVPNAKVEVINQGTKVTERSVVTAGDGTYVANLLPPGTYLVQITAPGFKQYKFHNVPVRLAEVARADAILQLGVSQETVNVEATGSLVNTENATTGQPLDTKTLAMIPLPSPNILFVLALSAGASGEPGDVRTAGRGTMDVNVNGQRTTNNSYSLEGVNVNDYNRAHFDFAPIPNPDAIQELKVATSLYDASSGSKGGGALQVVMRQGTKDVHWDAYWQNRNDAFNATEWFTKFNDSPTCKEYTLASTTCHKNRLAQNVVGGSISAPVPGLGGVIFGNYQAVRARNGVDPSGSTSNPIVPVFPTNLDGTTSAALLASVLPAGLRSAANIDPVAVNILNLKSNYWGGTFAVPRPGQPSCGTGTSSFSCAFSRVAPLSDNQFTIAYDRPLFHDKQKLSVRWFYDDFSAFLPFGANTGSSTIAYPTTNPNHNKFLSIGHTTQISNRAINDFKVGFSRFHFLQQPQDLFNLADISATRPNAGEIPGMYNVSISGLFALGVAANDDQGVVSNTYYWSDTYSRTFNHHTLRVGTEISRYQLNRFNRFVQRGIVNFASSVAQPTTGQPAFTAFQNFLRGGSTSLQVASGSPARYFRSKDISFFVQDDFRVSPRLTVNLGLRWEGMGYSKEVNNQMATYLEERAAAGLNPFAVPADLNLANSSVGEVSDCMTKSCFDTNNWAPRVGFAWDVFGDRKTVLRGGYGIYYQRISNQTVLQTSLAPPFTVQAIDTRADANPALVLANPWTAFPALAPPQASRFAGVSGNINTTGIPLFVNEAGKYCNGFAPSSVPLAQQATNCAISTASFTVPPQNFYTPYNQQWNLTLERELFHGWAVEVGYVGAHYVGGIGIYNPFVRLASATDPIAVKDINGTSYTITTNTTNNEPLRYTDLGLSRKVGARYAGNIGFAIYHSGQLTVSHRFQHGLFFQAGYTYSKTIDNVSGSMGGDELNITRNGQGGANMFNLANIDPALGRARGDFDRPHRLVVTYAYDLPVPHSGIWGSQAFQGWTLSGTTFFQSGLPFSVTSSNGGGAFGSGGNSTPDLICAPATLQNQAFPTCTPGTPTTIAQALMGGSIQSHVNNWLNPNMFTDPATAPSSLGSATLYGNTPRNAFRGPFQQDWDMAIAKHFRVREKHTVSFRADFFNAFNHPVFRAPATVSLGTRSTFGRINNTVIPARLIQFNLKYEH